eukprot:6197629-Pleurochrysis_carterae.AAC.2
MVAEPARTCLVGDANAVVVWMYVSLSHNAKKHSAMRTAGGECPPSRARGVAPRPLDHEHRNLDSICRTPNSHTRIP